MDKELTKEIFNSMIERFYKFRQTTEIVINGARVNLADYEEVTRNYLYLIPRGFRVFLNVRRSIYQKTFDPMATDLMLFNMPKKECVFAGGNQKEWKDLWTCFVDNQTYTSKERLYFIACARSPSIDRGEITEYSRRHLEAEIFAESQKLSWQELKQLKDWQLALLYFETIGTKN